MTQHALTPAQMQNNLCEFPEAQRNAIREALTIEQLPDRAELQQRAEKLAEQAAVCGARAVMIGGAPYLMPLLVQALRARRIRIFCSFSPRRSIERRRADGSVEKSAVFCYEGLIEL